MQKIYIVTAGTILSSDRHGKDFKEGETIDLSYLDEKNIEILKKSGKIADLPAPANKEKEVK